jgi:hypothetical protein
VLKNIAGIPYLPSMSDLATFLACGIVILAVIGIFIRISMKLRRGGGSMTTIALGATDAFLSHERRKAAETIVNENAGKRRDAEHVTTERL